MSKFQAIKGTRDILPPESALWNRVEQTAREVFATYGFGEIRLPIFEQTELFARSIGEHTDVVGKEMYSFPTGEADFNQVTLRPEATASVCRAYIEHGLHTRPGSQKLYYIGPMFRRERPQKGRYRQFYQIGAEVLTPAPRAEGEKSPDVPQSGTSGSGSGDLLATAAIDAEVIEMLMHFFARVGLGVRELAPALPSAQLAARSDASRQAGPQEGGGKPPHSMCTLYINSIGNKDSRRKYVEVLRVELEKVKDKLGPDSQRRIETNPLRVLDSKLESEQAIIEKLPRIYDFLDADDRAHYAELKRQLDLRSIAYEENWRLVRGLDYYMRTTFEITAPGLGAQNAVCGGGRYDGLVELLGGPPTRGIGFAIGTDRLILALQEAEKSGQIPQPALDVFIAWMGATDSAVYAAAVRAARELRHVGLCVELPAAEMKFRKSLELASKLSARFALILGEDEVASGQYTLKRLADGTQEKIPAADVAKKVASR